MASKGKNLLITLHTFPVQHYVGVGKFGELGVVLWKSVFNACMCLVLVNSRRPVTVTNARIDKLSAYRHLSGYLVWLDRRTLPYIRASLGAGCVSLAFIHRSRESLAF